MFTKAKKQESGMRRITLQQAVAEGLATFELRGVDEGVTSKVHIRITKHTDEPLQIVIPEGTEFVPVARPVEAGTA